MPKLTDEQYIKLHGNWCESDTGLSIEEERDVFDTVEDLHERLADLESTFELIHQSDMRAIALWQEAHPDRRYVWPDRTKMVTWLLERLESVRTEALGKAASAAEAALTDPNLEVLNGGEYTNVFSHVAAPLVIRAILKSNDKT